MQGLSPGGTNAQEWIKLLGPGKLNLGQMMQFLQLDQAQLFPT